MKILWFYKYIADYDFDNWLHLKFVEAIKKYPGVEIMVYGPDVHIGYPHLTSMKYDKKITIEDIQKEFDFDVIILNTKSRMFADYNPHKNIAEGEWLPKRFNIIDKPRIVIEEDYHYEKNDGWYAQNRIDLILQRHWSQSLRQENVPMQWFPFSVDTTMFRPGPAPRHNRICFAGSVNPTVYKMRWTACDFLKRAHLLDAFPNRQKHGVAYVDCLQEWISHLSCSSTYKLSSAKMFEIMAAGSALLTNENGDLPLLFPDGSYYTYKSDCSNVVHVAREIINDKARREETVHKGLQAIIARHSHQVRIGELINIISSIKSGK